MPAKRTPIEIPRGAKPNFDPIFGKVVIKVDQQPERKYGSLILPPKDAIASSIGRVHAVYKATETPDGFVEPQVQVGDLVIFGQFTGTAVYINEDLFIVCREHDLLSIVSYDGPQLEVATE